MLYAQGENVMALLRNSSTDDAINCFKQFVLPLRNAISPFVPYHDYVRGEIDRIEDAIRLGDWTSAKWPAHRNQIQNKILDYIRLYFPAYIGHNMLADKRTKKLWNLTMILTDNDGKPLRTSGNKIQFRCLACGWTGGSTTGIKAQQLHLAGEGGVAPCPMSTPRTFELMGLPAPQRQPQIAGRGKGPMSNDQIQGDLPSGSSVTIRALGLIDSIVVVRSHCTISILLDEIASELRKMGVYILALQPARTALQAVQISCNTVAPGQNRMIHAESIVDEITKARRAINEVWNMTYTMAGQELLKLFNLINQEMNDLETKCIQASAPTIAYPGLIGAGAGTSHGATSSALLEDLQLDLLACPSGTPPLEAAANQDPAPAVTDGTAEADGFFDFTAYAADNEQRQAATNGWSVGNTEASFSLNVIHSVLNAMHLF